MRQPHYGGLNVKYFMQYIKILTSIIARLLAQLELETFLQRLVIRWSGRPILTAGVVRKCDVGEESAQNGLRGKIGGLPVRHFGNGNGEGSILQCADFRHGQKDPDH